MKVKAYSPVKYVATLLDVPSDITEEQLTTGIVTVFGITPLQVKKIDKCARVEVDSEENLQILISDGSIRVAKAKVRKISHDQW